MTHKDIFTKFMIEYDKANVTSSYPSLTEYEIATVLDKAYMALIAQKVTGNNIRKAPFEADIKSVADLLPLVTTIDIDFLYDSDQNPLHNFVPHNVRISNLPPDMLYFVSAAIKYQQSLGYFINPSAAINNTQGDSGRAYDGANERFVYANLVSHQIAQRFFATGNNIPWVKNPVCYIEDDKLYTVLDTELAFDEEDEVCLTYIKKPNTFAKDLDKIIELFVEVSFQHLIDDHFDQEPLINVQEIDNESIVPYLVLDESDYDETMYFRKNGCDFYYLVDLNSVLHIVDESTLSNPEKNDIADFLADFEGDAVFVKSNHRRTLQVTKFYTDDNSYVYAYILGPHTYGRPLFKSLEGIEYNDNIMRIPDIAEIYKDCVKEKAYSHIEIETEDLHFITEKGISTKFGEKIAASIDKNVFDLYQFELNDIAAEELISLAVTYALENVESLRLNTHLGVRGLEG